MSMENFFHDPRQSFKGSICFDIQKLSYFAGDSINGSILIDLREEYEGSILVLSLEGIEEINYSPLNQKSNNEVKRILNRSKFVHDFSCSGQSKLQPGNWKINFDFDIPQDLPSQVNLFYDYENCYRINYYLCAYIIPSNLTFKPLQGVQRILISKQNYYSDTPAHQQIKDYPKKLLFLSIGEFMLACNIPKTHFYPGEKANILIDYDFSKLEKIVKEIKIEVIGYLTKIKKHKSQNELEGFNVISTSLHITQQRGVNNFEICVPITSPLTVEGEVAKLDFKLVLSPVFNKNNSYTLKSLQQDIIIHPNKSYFSNIHMPRVKQTKNSNQSKQFQLIEYPNSLHNNQAQYIQFSETQEEYSYYYSVEKNISST